MTTILQTISKNFYIYANDPFICLLGADDLKTMLKHKRLQVTCEDEVIRAIYIWVMDPARTQEEISMVVANICWNYVSLPCLFDFV